ncbi:MAG: hypothetical protein CVU07_07090 [Bacteroidetes bacterium HGW-Bacteroidetes-23]|nr:MAG: hypothetical protein CVU07_07090 [Bacteroidetes bacterium HGW-Bacteroidetes-23]
MKKIIFILIVFQFLSCIKKENRLIEINETSNDTIYTRLWINYPSVEKPNKSIEYYISSKTDTIFNQTKVYKNGILDTLKSEFYELEIYKTKKPNLYKGKIILHSRFDKLQINDMNKRKLQFLYLEFNDSLNLRSVSSKSSNQLEFEFINTKNNHLTGVLIQDVFRDTLINNEKLLNYGKTRILVDTDNETDNLFISSHQFLKEKRLKK